VRLRPSAAAVLMLMAKSNLVGCATVMSPGVVPCRIGFELNYLYRTMLF
jgi:hypothetical protein